MLEEPITFVLAPIDQGVRNVGGRPGAAEGPETLLAGLREAGVLPGGSRVRRVEVEGTESSLEADLDRLSEAVETVLREDRFPIVLGGDHGTSYATVRGASRVLEGLGVAYLDVHFDMRPYEPRHTSGSSFRRLIEEGWVRADRVLPVGIQDPGSPEAREQAGYEQLRAWADDHGVPWVPFEDALRRGPADLLRAEMDEGPWCFSLDTDALDARWAPGVSAPGEGRFSLDQAAGALGAGLEKARVLDVVEYAPSLDEEDRTRESLVQLLGSVLDGAGSA